MRSVEVDPEDDPTTLRPAGTVRREDAWAYTAEHRKLLERAHADSREGRVRIVSDEDLERLIHRDRP